MEYKNFSLRLISSLFFIFTYSFIFVYYPNQIFYFISIIYLLIFIEIFLYFSRLKITIIIYLFFSYSFLIYYFFNDLNYLEFTIIIFYIICFDSFSYLIGKGIGKRKIFYKISPNKTYAGLIGGILITNLLSLIFFYYFDILKNNIFFNFVFVNIVVGFAFFGDLLQSYFKRSNKLKDSSNFIPGHGGFFDRFDSFLLVIIPLSLIKLLF